MHEATFQQCEHERVLGHSEGATTQLTIPVSTQETLMFVNASSVSTDFAIWVNILMSVIWMNMSERLPVLTQNSVSALQLVGVFAAAQVVDKVAELVNVLQALSHHHLLMDQVRLRQVGAGLSRGRSTAQTRHMINNNNQ